jgi:hypothetical protein
MNPDVLDSRMSLGSDQYRRSPQTELYPETSMCVGEYFVARTVRVILGHLGDSYRFSAPQLQLVADGETIQQAWSDFLAAVRIRDDASWLRFDVGPTRPDEITAGLDAPEDEDWAEPAV